MIGWPQLIIAGTVATILICWAVVALLSTPRDTSKRRKDGRNV